MVEIIINKEDLKEGQYYVNLLGNSIKSEIIFRRENGYNAPFLNPKLLIYAKINCNTSKDIIGFRKATPIEIAWLLTCEALDKYVSKDVIDENLINEMKEFSSNYTINSYQIF